LLNPLICASGAFSFLRALGREFGPSPALFSSAIKKRSLKRLSFTLSVSSQMVYALQTQFSLLFLRFSVLLNRSEWEFPLCGSFLSSPTEQEGSFFRLIRGACDSYLRHLPVGFSSVLARGLSLLFRLVLLSSSVRVFSL